MTDELLPYYNNELEFLRRAGSEFAEAKPRIAARLRMSGGLPDDPHVERLIEAFAYLNARTRHKLDDDFPEITEAFLNIVFPHYLVPVPSASIVKFALDRGQADQTDGQRVPKGTEVETEVVHGKGIDGETCRFRTAYPVHVWPMALTGAAYNGHPFVAPPARFADRSESVCHIECRTFAESVHFAQLPLRELRLHLHGHTRYVYDLYELFHCNLLGIAIAPSAKAPAAALLPPTALRPVGFQPEEGLFEYPARSFVGYRLLTEYFAFPHKFMFFDVAQIPARALAELGNELHLFFYFDRYLGDLENVVGRDTFHLGCAPAVNLFRKRSEPIRLTFTQSEYRVVPDSHRPLANEVYSVERVMATSPKNEEIEFRPFYSFKHAEDARRQETFWYASRRRAGYAAGEVDSGLECYLTLVDLGFRPSVPHDWTIHVDTLCTNRDLPRRLPFGGGQPHLQVAGKALVRASCLTAPTMPLRPELRHGTMWRLISHLTLNHISLINDTDGASALREILSLYNFRDSPETEDIIDGLLSVQSKRIVGRAGGSAAGICRGLHVRLHFDEDKFSGGGLLLYAAVLERFLGLYTSINSFTKVTATSKQREKDIHTWPPRSGEQALL